MAMTMREMYVAIMNGEVTDEVKAMAQAQLEKMDVANARKASKAHAQKDAVNGPLMEQMTLLLKDKNEGMTAAEVGGALGVSTQKAQALLRKLVEAGTLTVEDIKVKGVGTRKMYRG